MVFFEVCGPNEAMVVSGCCHSKPLLVPGGRVFVWPGIQKLQRLSLNTLTLMIESSNVYTQLGVAVSVQGVAQTYFKCADSDHRECECEYMSRGGYYCPRGRAGKTTRELSFDSRISLNTLTLLIESVHVTTQLGVPMNVIGVAQVKIQGQNQEMLATACQQFLGKSEVEIRKIAQETLEGHQRAIMGNMTVEEIYKDRKKFSKAVFEVASSDLVNMGISVVSYTLKDIRDDEGYLKSLGMARTAQVKRDARIGEAEARRDAGIKEAIAEEQRMASRFTNDIQIAKAQRNFELKKAAYDMEVQTEKAKSELSYDLQAAKTKQKIKEEQMQIKVVERSQQILVQEQEITRKERELDANVKKPAEAEKYKLEKLAEADRNRIILEAEADAEAIKVRGDAEAFAITQKAKAEAEQMAKKADAWKDYQDAAMVDMILETLPKIAAEVSAPLAECKKITMVSNGTGSVGASKLTGEIMDIIERMPQVVQSMTGVDISKSMKTAMRRS